MQNDLTAQERAAKVTWLLAHGKKLTTQEIMELTGLARSSVWFLMMNLARVVPIVCNDAGEWCKVEIEGIAIEYPN